MVLLVSNALWHVRTTCASFCSRSWDMSGTWSIALRVLAAVLPLLVRRLHARTTNKLGTKNHFVVEERAGAHLSTSLA
mgnify:CR=1 FL=1